MGLFRVARALERNNEVATTYPQRHMPNSRNALLGKNIACATEKGASGKDDLKICVDG